MIDEPYADGAEESKTANETKAPPAEKVDTHVPGAKAYKPRRDDADKE